MLKLNFSLQKFIGGDGQRVAVALTSLLSSYVATLPAVPDMGSR